MTFTPVQALLCTLAYADIFDYPLTEEEIRHWLVGEESRLTVPMRSKYIDRHKTYFFLHGRKSIVAIRNRRHLCAKKKWKHAQYVCKALQIIPTIELVGVTGGLAMNNVDKSDDIDLFFIVKDGSIWISRFLAVLVVSIIAKRRKPRSEEVEDAFCLNMFVSISGMSVPESDRSLYTSHEVLQMKPVWSRSGVYQSFIRRNSWVERYIPAAYARAISHEDAGVKRVIFEPVRAFFANVLRVCEPFVKGVQLQYMKKRRTTETISDTIIRFHPNDAKTWVYSALKTRLDSLGVPLDKKIFAG